MAKFNINELLNNTSKGNNPEENKTISVVRTPTEIAAEINDIKEKTRKMVLQNSIEIGRRLVEAKSMLGHGEWGAWLKKSVDYSQSTANNLMKIFNEYGSNQITLLDNNSKSQAFGNLTYTQAVALLGIPEEEREDFVKENNVEEMSTRELQKVIKERDEALKEKEKAEEFAKEKEEESKKVLDEKQKIEAEREKAEEEKAALEASFDETVNELINSNKKIKELKDKIKEKPIEVIAAPRVEESVVRFNVYFNNAETSLEDVLKSLSEVRQIDDGKYIKCKNDIADLINKILRRLT